MRAITVTSLAAVLACSSTPAAPIAEVAGTWGGEDAGLIATDSSAHIHIGCTLGEARGTIRPDADGRFVAEGTYNVDAYPIDRGIIHPARFTGRIVGQSMTLTLVLTDTSRQLGPVTLVRGKEPRMGPCPICRNPNELRKQTSTLNREQQWQKMSTKSSS